MKLLQALPGSLLLLTTLSLNTQAASFDDWGISMMDIRGVSPNPVMEVSTTDGAEYDLAANKDLVFKVEAKARCQNLHWVNHGQILIYPKNASTIGDNYGNKVIIAKPNINMKTWSNDWSPITISFAPNTTLKSQAMAACNAELDKRIAQGGKKADILKAGFETTMNKTDNQFNFTCSGPSPHATHPKSVENNHPITVKCGSYTPKRAVVDPKTLPSFKLVSADITMAETNYQGSCPADLPVKATITSNDIGGKFEYRFLEDGKPVGSWKQKNVAKGATSTLLAHTLTIKPPRAKKAKSAQDSPGGFQKNNQGNAEALPQLEQVPTRNVSIEVKRTGQQMSDSQTYQATCKTAPVIKAAIATPKVEDPDLTSREGITIGTKSSSWGGLLNLSKSDAVSQNSRGCRFRFKYDVVNIGKANSGPATHHLQNVAVLHSEKNFAVNRNDSRYVSGHILLKSGHHLLTLKLDQSNAVNESNENNNLFSINVNVAGDCGGASANPSGAPGTNIPGTPPRPGTSAAPTGQPNPHTDPTGPSASATPQAVPTMPARTSEQPR